MSRALGAILVLLLAACASNQGADFPEAARANTQLGVDYLRRGQLETAHEKLQRALDQDERYAPAHTAMALLLQRQGDPQGAEKHFRRALSLDAQNPEMKNNFGVFLCGQGKTIEADRYFMDAAFDKHYTTPEVAWTNAGVCAKSYDLAKADQDLRQALQLRPDFPQALAQLASVAYQKQDYLSTRAFLQRFDAVGQPSAETLWLGVRTERQLGDEIAARKYEYRLRHDFPESVEAGYASQPPNP